MECSPSIRSSHRSKLLCRFYTYLVNDDLEEDIYDASVAGLHYGLSRGNESLILSMHGYDDKLPLLLKVSKICKVSGFSCRPLRLRDGT